MTDFAHAATTPWHRTPADTASQQQMPAHLTRWLMVLATLVVIVGTVVWLRQSSPYDIAISANANSISEKKDNAGLPASRVPEPDDYRHDDYRKPVPATLKGATVLTAPQALELWSQKSAVFIDVYPRPPKPPNLPAGTLWRDPSHQTVEHAKWLPNVGYGVLSAEVDSYFRRNLTVLTSGDLSKPIVLFCLRDCWMSWNSAKRALAYGYTRVYWFPDGTDAWQEIGQLVVDVQPEK